MWSASGTPKAAPAAVTTPQMTLIGIGGEDHWHLHRPQLLQALGGCARQIFAGELIYPRPASSEGDLATAAKDAELAARIRCKITASRSRWTCRSFESTDTQMGLAYAIGRGIANGLAQS